jgi:hypothetical protein
MGGGEEGVHWREQLDSNYAMVQVTDDGSGHVSIPVRDENQTGLPSPFFVRFFSPTYQLNTRQNLNSWILFSILEVQARSLDS